MTECTDVCEAVHENLLRLGLAVDSSEHNHDAMLQAMTQTEIVKGQMLDDLVGALTFCTSVLKSQGLFDLSERMAVAKAHAALAQYGAYYAGVEKVLADGPPDVSEWQAVCPLTRGDVGKLYDEYVQALWAVEEMPRWKDLTPERRAEVVDIAARLLYLDGERLSSNFSDAFEDRLRGYLAEIEDNHDNMLEAMTRTDMVRLEGPNYQAIAVTARLLEWLQQQKHLETCGVCGVWLLSGEEQWSDPDSEDAQLLCQVCAARRAPPASSEGGITDATV